MIISASSTASRTNFQPRRIRQAAFGLAAVVLAIGMSAPADAASVRRGQAYDGTWNVVFTTKTGHCSSNNSAPFNVAGRRVSSAGGGKVTGGIRPNGTVIVRISVGLSAASGTGRLAGNFGSGRWNGVISGDRCSGTWQATRT